MNGPSERANEAADGGKKHRLTPIKDAFSTLLSRLAAYPPTAVVAAVIERDKDAAGGVAGSAIAFRLFLFFVPLLLLVVGILGFISGFLTAQEVAHGVGVSGTLAAQIRSAFAEPTATRWLATGLGLLGMLTAGRSLSKVLISSSAIAWRVPAPRRASLRTVGSVAGLVLVMGLLTIVVNRLREEFGLSVASASLLPTFVIYVAAWIGVSSLLPRGTSDPGALLPGALVVAFTITAMQGLSEFYMPDKLSRAGELYGAIGTTVATLGWFFFLGRAVAVSTELNAVLYERYGSVSGPIFSLPVLRLLPAKSGRFRRFFDLEKESSPS
jgi:uncharacterized BrkB/YihY/UPF0761 family membrane protein